MSLPVAVPLAVPGGQVDRYRRASVLVGDPVLVGLVQRVGQRAAIDEVVTAGPVKALEDLGGAARENVAERSSR